MKRRIMLAVLTLLVLAAITTTGVCFDCDSATALDCRNQAMKEYQECFEIWGYDRLGAAMCRNKYTEACSSCMFLKGCPATQCTPSN